MILSGLTTSSMTISARRCVAKNLDISTLTNGMVILTNQFLTNLLIMHLTNFMLILDSLAVLVAVILPRIPLNITFLTNENIVCMVKI